jgi:hypothetical protein
MTSERAQAYGRVMATIESMGAAKLHPDEEQMLRNAADSLLFCEDVAADPAAGAALAEVRALAARLVESGRWLTGTALRLMADVELCGPPVARARVAS